MEKIIEYFPDLNEKQIEQFTALKGLYTDWNSKINVVSRKDIDALYTRHVLHSLGIVKIMPFAQNSKVLDVGTGGGFPGIPLAILFPDVEFHLIDAIGKKIKVVQEVANALKLENVRAQQIRAQNVEDKFDFIISRAVTNMPDFVQWIKLKITKENKNTLKNGILYLKGGDLSEELKNYPKAIEYPLSEYFKEDFFETKKVVYLPLKYRG